ncbi:SIMPL domain-containing protein [Actinoplanes sp. NPDC048791]|uniref:SIMPL domain-containing protein n=1 Tax=Actinoplanes sp. NPDC048791 TaxID=3154623 RepID=UPI0033E6AEE4
MAEQPMIVVRGEATREVPPELAIFSVTVSARDKDRQTALTRLTERAAELRSHLDDFPDAIERRETSGVQVHPELKRGGERISAYTGSVTTTVTVTDFAVLGELLLRLADRDQTSLSGPWWQLRPGSRAGAEVRRAAIADALGRAREYAEAVGAQVDRLVEIADENAGGGGQPMMRMAAFGGAPEADLALEVDPQVQTVHASVLVRVTITEPTALK